MEFRRLVLAAFLVMSASAVCAQDTRLDHFGMADKRLPVLCGSSFPDDVAALVAAEGRLADSAKKPRVATDLWRSLGCVRSLLYAHSPSPSGTGRTSVPHWAASAVDALSEALAENPGDALAAETAAVLALDLTSGPSLFSAVRYRHQFAELAFAAARAGVTAPPVLRACAEFAIDVGDLATARYCTQRALDLGVDSTWHLIRQSWLAGVHNDSTTGALLFDRALTAAHDRAAIGEFAAHAQWIAAAKWKAPGRLDSALASVPEAGRPGWLQGNLAGQRSYPEMLTRAEANPGFLGPVLALCPFELEYNGTPDSSFGCLAPALSTVSQIDVVSQLYQLWDPRTGAPLGLLTYAINRGGLATKRSERGRVVTFDLEVRQWEWATHRWTDSIVELEIPADERSKGRSQFTGRLTVLPPTGTSSWTLSVAQPGRYGHITTDGKIGLGTGAMVLSDLVLGVESQGLSWQLGADQIVLAPLNTVSRAEPLHLFYQVRSDARQSSLRTSIAVRRIVAGRIVEPPALTIAFSTAVPQGLSQVERELDLSRISGGDCQLEVQILDASGNVAASRTTNLYLR